MSDSPGATAVAPVTHLPTCTADTSAMDRGHWHAARTSAYSDAVSASARLVSATTIVIIVRSVRAGRVRPRVTV